MKLPVEVLGVTVGYVKVEDAVSTSANKVENVRAELISSLFSGTLAAGNVIDRRPSLENRVYRLCNELADAIDRHNILLEKISEYETPF